MLRVVATGLTDGRARHHRRAAQWVGQMRVLAETEGLAASVLLAVVEDAGHDEDEMTAPAQALLADDWGTSHP